MELFHIQRPVRFSWLCHKDKSWGLACLLYALCLMTPGIETAKANDTNNPASPDLTMPVAGQFIFEIRNGDRFSGRVLDETISLSISGINTNLPVREILKASLLSSNSSQAVFTLANEISVQGELNSKQIQIRLEIGPDLSLACGWIKSFEQTGLKAAAHVQKGLEDASLASLHVEDMVWISPGEFPLGSFTEEYGRDRDEGPQTQMVIDRGFWIGKHEVTQKEYRQTMEVNPSIFTSNSQLPVERVNWQEAMEYCARRTKLEQDSGAIPSGAAYRLPTEAEWEYACRAGTTTRFSFGDDKNLFQLGNYAWFMDNSDSSTHPVGTKQPNSWGLYDMHGNVWEWCLDCWDGGYPGKRTTNVVTQAKGALRVARGGSWLYDWRAARSANRDEYGRLNRCSDVGFRVVLAPE